MSNKNGSSIALNEQAVKKLPFKIKIGYGAGAASDSIAYEFIAALLLFFLTDIAGVNPVFGGMIVSIAIVWDAVADPIIGNLSDKTVTKLGRRRPWLIASIVPLVTSMIFLFTTFDIGVGAKNVYYLVVALVFWTSYASFCIPYYALGPSLTSDYEDRTVMRAIGQICQYVGVFCATSLPTMIVAWKIGKGTEPADAWQFAAIILAILGGIFIFITFVSTKGRDISEEKAVTQEEKSNLFKDCWEILKIKAFRISTFAALLYRVGYAFTMTSAMYYILYVAGLTEGDSSMFFLTLAIAGIIFTSALAKFGVKFDKKRLIIICIGLCGIAMCVFRFIDISTVSMLVTFALFYTVGSATYWTLNLSLVYDMSEVDEFKNNKRREGTIFAFFLFTNKLAYALTALLAGALLSWSGYDAFQSLQPERALNQITNMFTLYPGISMILCIIVMLFYPGTRERYELLLGQLMLKREGKEYNNEGFEQLIK